MTESDSPVETATPMLGHALLVGVEDYRAYDPSGKRNLLSGRNDVLAFWKVCRKLRYEPQNILLLTSPMLTEDDLFWAERELAPILHEGKTNDEIRDLVRGWLSGDPPAPGETEESFRRRFEKWTSERASSGAPARVFRGEATSWAVRQGAGWLAASLIVNPGLGLFPIPGISLPGFFSYSGHGATKNGKLALCPSDVTSDLGGALLLEDMGKIFGGMDLEQRDDVRPTDDLTIVLDCCFAGAGDAAGGAQRVSGLGTSSGEGAHPSEIGNRVFCAAGPHEQACQAMLGGYWYGAFTWALTVALEQWTMEPEGLSWMSRVSHTELLFRARMLLKALSFRQHPMLLDGGGIGNEPVFRHGRGGREKARPAPDENRPGVQLDPNQRYVFSWVDEQQNEVPCFWVDALDGTTKYGYLYGNKEYWFSSGRLPSTLRCRQQPVAAGAAVTGEIQAAYRVTTCNTRQPDSVWTSRTTTPFTRDPYIEGGIQSGQLRSAIYKLDPGQSQNLVGIEIIDDAEMGIRWTNWFVQRAPTAQDPKVLSAPTGTPLTFTKVAGVGDLGGYDFYAKIGLSKATG